MWTASLEIMVACQHPVSSEDGAAVVSHCIVSHDTNTDTIHTDAINTDFVPPAGQKGGSCHARSSVAVHDGVQHLPTRAWESACSGRLSWEPTRLELPPTHPTGALGCACVCVTCRPAVATPPNVLQLCAKLLCVTQPESAVGGEGANKIHPSPGLGGRVAPVTSSQRKGLIDESSAKL